MGVRVAMRMDASRVSLVCLSSGRAFVLLQCIAAVALARCDSGYGARARLPVAAFVPASPRRGVAGSLRRHACCSALKLQHAAPPLGTPQLPLAQRAKRATACSLRMGGAGQEDGLQMVNFGRTKELAEQQAASEEAADAGGTQQVPNQAVLDELSVSSWWKHDPKHRTQVDGKDLSVDYDQMLGDGTYGEVFMAKFTGGKHRGKEAVVKRAKDGLQDPMDPVKYVKKERSKQMEEHDELAAAYLTTEGYVNDLVMDSCSEAAAPYLGMMTKKGKRWLVWEFLDGATLEDLLLECDECYSLQPLARAVGINDFVDGDIRSLRILVNKIALQLLSHCLALEKAGVAHRDIKPFNIFVADQKLLLIDFGSAAAMGIRERVGYDYNKSPCDPRYAPPEQFIDEVEWAKYDVYCVGLILVRILFPPLWSGQHFDEFSESYHSANYQLDTWLSRLIQEDEALGDSPQSTAGFKNPIKSLFKKRGSDDDARDQTYVDLAEQSCNFPDDGSLLNMCSIKEGLEVLAVKQGGVCWETMRRLLARDPSVRLSSRAALERVAEADRPDSWSTIDGVPSKSKSWINPFRHK